jgi:hypothetical protein
MRSKDPNKYPLGGIGDGYKRSSTITIIKPRKKLLLKMKLFADELMSFAAKSSPKKKLTKFWSKRLMSSAKPENPNGLKGKLRH